MSIVPLLLFDCVWFAAEGRVAASAAAVTFSGNSSFLLANAVKAGSENASSAWISGALAIPAAGSILYSSSDVFPFPSFFS